MRFARILFAMTSVLLLLAGCVNTGDEVERLRKETEELRAEVAELKEVETLRKEAAELPAVETERQATPTSLPPTATPLPPTATPLPPTATPLPPTATPLPPTATPLPPTATPLSPTATTSGCIVFASNRDGDYDIYSMDVNGGNVQQLTTTTDDPAFMPESAIIDLSKDDTNPVWSPDGTRIVFMKTIFSPPKPTNPRAFIMDADGGNIQPIVQLLSNGNTRPLQSFGPLAWSLDGNHIAFTSLGLSGDLGSRIHVWEFSGDTAANGYSTSASLSNAGLGDSDRFPTWSPDGTQIAFQSARDGDYDIYVMDANGGNVQQLTDDPGRDGLPDWSPDGSRIAFVSDRDGDNEIYVMDVNGGNIQQLTDNPGSDSTPDWSPDGTQIVFASNRDGDSDIYVMAAYARSRQWLPQQLTNDEAADIQPAWCPG